MLRKLMALGTTSLAALALTAAMPPSPRDDPPPKAKKKEGPGGDLKKTYDLLRRLRSDGHPAGRPEERLKDWTDRATKLYRDALNASAKGEGRQAREFGTAAHDLARAIDHVRNAASTDLEDLPAPPDGDDEADRARHDLTRARERVVDLRDSADPEAKFYFDAAKDLYNAARRDAESGRAERSGELARAAEALTHVPEHLARALDDRPEPKEKKAKKDRPEPKEKKDRPEAKEKAKEKEKEKAKEKEKEDRPGRDGEIPPPID